MKSKFVLLIVFFSLLLTISHDLVLAKKSSHTYSETLTQEDKQHHNSIHLHEMFHFSAILSTLEVPYSLGSLYSTPHFTILISPTFIYQNNFRPPIA